MPRGDCGGDTVVALATSPGRAALATIRLSGRSVRDILQQVLRTAARGSVAPTLVDRTATLTQFVDPVDGEPIDQVLVTFFAGPRSYTGEDLAEIGLHGGPWLVAEALRVLTSLGALPARPGEFTRRALLAGKLDLARAEAVQALVAARSSAAAKLAARHLAGGLSAQYQRLRQDLLSLVALLEGPLEFPDDALEDEERATREALARLAGIDSCLTSLIGSYRHAHRIVDGTSVSIVGRPNVGKSSIFNRLLGSSRAIVSPRAGTTRDCVEASMVSGGQLVRLVDTAGMGVALDELDHEAMRRTRLQIDQADVVVLVLDRSVPVDPLDRELAASLAGRTLIVVLNKSDLPSRLDLKELAELNLPIRPVPVSAIDGDGFPALFEQLSLAVANPEGQHLDADGVVTNARQRALLARALDDLARADMNIRRGRTELAIEDVRLAELDLAEILGESSRDDVLDQVFREFCVGK